LQLEIWYQQQGPKVLALARGSIGGTKIGMQYEMCKERNGFGQNLVVRDLRYMVVHENFGFWYTAQCILVYGYQRFGGACCLHLQGILALKVEAERFDTYMLRSNTWSYSKTLKSVQVVMCCIVNRSHC
jgi:hypothetical protein